MRLLIQSENRLGITQQMLAVFARHAIDVRAVDMFTHHTFVDAPDVTRERLAQIAPDLLAIDGVTNVVETNILPSEERREQLAAILSSLHEPVVAIDTRGDIILANRAAARAFGADDLAGRALSDYVADEVIGRIEAEGFAFADREISLGKQRFLIRCTPFGLGSSEDRQVLGGVVFLNPIEQIGRMMTAVNDRGVAGLDDLVGKSTVMGRVRERALRLAAIDAPLLIIGETGSGKDMLARACHMASARKDAPFLAFDCAALTESEAEVELFGRAEGAFRATGEAGKPGLFELANNGAVCIHNVSELSPYLQARLAQFLESGETRRIGAASGRAVNVRIMASTKADLAALAAEGRFREDLLYRLNVLNIQLPPLAQRTGDIPALAEAFVHRAAIRLGRPVPHVTQEAYWRLRHRKWPGNVRQLENVVFQTLIEMEPGAPIKKFVESEEIAMPVAADEGSTEWRDLEAATDAFEKQLLQKLYRKHNSSRKLAERLRTSHSTIARKLRKYGIA